MPSDMFSSFEVQLCLFFLFSAYFILKFSCTADTFFGNISNSFITRFVGFRFSSYFRHLHKNILRFPPSSLFSSITAWAVVALPDEIKELCHHPA